MKASDHILTGGRGERDIGTMTRPGTAMWFAAHEARMAWREWLSMMTAGKAERRRRVAIGIAVFVIVMHAIAYTVIDPYAGAAPGPTAYFTISTTLLLSFLLMVSQAMETVTRAFYARADLDLVLSSPAASEKLFAVRIFTVALSVAAMALPLAAPLIDMLIWRGGWRWAGAYAAIPALAAAATALAAALTVLLFRVAGAKRTRLISQILAAVIGAAFVIGLQIAAILSYGTLSRESVLRSQALIARAPDLDSVVWYPARAVLGDAVPLFAMLAVAALLLTATILWLAPRFGDYALAAAGNTSHASGPYHARRARVFAPISPASALRQKEWLLLRRDPWLVSQTLMQMLYLLPPAVLLWQGFRSGGGAFNLLVPVLVMAAGQLAGGLAWLTISGEDAPDLIASAPVKPRAVLRARVEAVLAIIAVIFVPLLAVIAFGSPWHAVVTLGFIIVAASSATAIQLWFRSQAKRSQFRRRQVSSRVATFAEAFSSITWAATAAVAAVSPLLAIAPGMIALGVVGGARFLSPRQVD
jgi:ABC-2 type transport system permease protein